MGTSSWGHFRSALAGGIVAALLMATPMVMASNGDYLVLGQKNNALRMTKLISRSGLQIQSSQNIPLQLYSPIGVPPMLVNQTAKVTNLNADRVDGKHAWQLMVPSGAVMFFDAASCPSGWSIYTPAQGRTLVGLQPGGILEGTNGSALADRASPTAAGHKHLWSYFDPNSKSWKTYGSDGNQALLVDYGNGIADGGSGQYPLAPYSSHVDSGILRLYYTAHQDSPTAVNMPYLQLLTCKKI